jgi:two-component system cell cycle response regulator
LAERIRSAVSEKPIEVNPGASVTLTVSVGVASIHVSRDEADLKGAAERLLSDADAALYRAKQKGRNRVELA